MEHGGWRNIICWFFHDFDNFSKTSEFLSPWWKAFYWCADKQSSNIPKIDWYEVFLNFTWKHMVFNWIFCRLTLQLLWPMECFWNLAYLPFHCPVIRYKDCTQFSEIRFRNVIWTASCGCKYAKILTGFSVWIVKVKPIDQLSKTSLSVNSQLFVTTFLLAVVFRYKHFRYCKSVLSGLGFHRISLTRR